MRIGIGLETGGTIEEVVDRARGLASNGVSSLWASQIFGWDTLTLLGLVGREVPSVHLGTAVIPVHPRHPAALAAQALTVQAATGGRLILGIGLSHQMVVEGLWGMSFARPARYMSEYLSVLLPLLRGETVAFEGEMLKTNMPRPLTLPPVTPPEVLVAALGPEMLKLAGRRASGTVTWMVGLRTLSDHVVPTITSAAEEVSRPRPRVVVNLPVCVTSDRQGAIERASKVFAMYGQLPSYRAMLDREGAKGPADVAIAGDEEEVSRSVMRFAEAGATDFSGAAFGSGQELTRTQRLLGDLARADGR